ncbi:MAG TPA: dTMP kinase [Solirubrobacteraceae bacterium]|nr:dTMP kinase [Solirubrobacteraceae bacterium]
MARGKLITIEGIDGAGKSTLADALLAALRARDIDAVVMREPGGVPTAERIRALVKDPEAVIDARAEALLYAAARAQLVSERLRPALAAGTTVVLDRFVDSSLVYQGVGRWLGIDAVRAINEFATDGLIPDRTLLLVLAPEVGRARSRGRGERLDRLEREDDPFFERIAAAYRRLAQSEPKRIREIDADQPSELVLTAALQQLSDLF